MSEVSAALRVYHGYRYTITIITNTPKRQTAEAELWWQKASEPTTAKWSYFRREVAANGAEAARKLEAHFFEWIEGQREAES
jgi:hypothetical protein